MIERKDYPTYIYLHSDLVITNFRAGEDDIRDYKGNKNVYLPASTEDEIVNSYYEITEEEHFEYERQREEAEHPEPEPLE